MAKSTVVATFYNFNAGTGNPSGLVRLIESDSASTPVAYDPTVVTGTAGTGVDLENTDPIAFYFHGVGGLRVMVVERVTGPAPTYPQLPCEVSLYDPADWSITMPTQPMTFPDTQDLLNVYSITSPASPAGTIFGADYSTGRIFRMEHGSGTPETLSITHFYPFVVTSPGAAYSVDTAIHGGELIAVAQQYSKINNGASPSDYTYYPSSIVRLNLSNLTKVTGTAQEQILAPNIFDIQGHGSHLYATALGGAQWNSGATVPTQWNEESRIQKVGINGTAFTVDDLVRPATVAEALPDDSFDIRSLAVLYDGMGGTPHTTYILTGSYNASFAYYGRLWKTTFADLNGASDSLISDLLPSDPPVDIDEVYGYLWAVLPAEEVNKVWGMLGDALGVYDTGPVTGTTPLDAPTATGWSAGDFPAYNAVNLAMPSVTRVKGAPKATGIKSVRGFVHPMLAHRAGVKPEEFEAFVRAYSGK